MHDTLTCTAVTAVTNVCRDSSHVSIRDRGADLTMRDCRIYLENFIHMVASGSMASTTSGTSLPKLLGEDDLVILDPRTQQLNLDAILPWQWTLQLKQSIASHCSDEVCRSVIMKLLVLVSYATFCMCSPCLLLQVTHCIAQQHVERHVQEQKFLPVTSRCCALLVHISWVLCEPLVPQWKQIARQHGGSQVFSLGGSSHHAGWFSSERICSAHLGRNYCVLRLLRVSDLLHTTTSISEHSKRHRWVKSSCEGYLYKCIARPKYFDAPAVLTWPWPDIACKQDWHCTTIWIYIKYRRRTQRNCCFCFVWLTGLGCKRPPDFELSCLHSKLNTMYRGPHIWCDVIPSASHRLKTLSKMVGMITKLLFWKAHVILSCQNLPTLSCCLWWCNLGSIEIAKLLIHIQLQ